MDVKELTARLNTLRDHYKGQEFKGAEMTQLLTSYGFRKGSGLLTALAKFECIVKIGNARWAMWHFTTEPVHYTRVENALKELHKYQPKVKKLNEENAIELLKSLGYVIKKRVVTYEEI